MMRMLQALDRLVEAGLLTRVRAADMRRAPWVRGMMHISVGLSAQHALCERYSWKYTGNGTVDRQQGTVNRGHALLGANTKCALYWAM